MKTIAAYSPLSPWHSVVASSGLMLTLMACQGGSPTTPPGVEVSPIAEGVDIDHPAVEIPATARKTRRLSVDQLQTTLPVIAGTDLQGRAITWTVAARNGTIEATADNALGKTLGRPDYVTVTFEAAEPDTLYLKFMDDMARDVCPKILDADYGRTSAASRTLLRFTNLDNVSDTAALQTNMAYLHLRFFGDKVTSNEETAPLMTLFQTVVDQKRQSNPQSDDATLAREGWNAVCVGLFLSPSFHLY